MTQAERERRHQTRLQQINRVQVVAGTGDGARLDHEATLLERARMMDDELASHFATERGLAAFDRLLRIAQEQRHEDVAAFLDAVWNGKPLPLAALRVEPPLGDDMLAVLDAYRYARLGLAEHVPGGARRVARVLRGLAPVREG
jgi:hypothetical protein